MKDNRSWLRRQIEWALVFETFCGCRHWRWGNLYRLCRPHWIEVLRMASVQERETA